MDLNAAKIADDRVARLTRAGMFACFLIASVLLLTSLALAKGVPQSIMTTAPAAGLTLH